ncbi:MAG TPA: hypothetical protein VD973_25780 [Symbiobacteriaceae bacterium]|nr:hypothetical protein [Symbiobacteriaceae bacterium]
MTSSHVAATGATRRDGASMVAEDVNVRDDRHLVGQDNDQARLGPVPDVPVQLLSQQGEGRPNGRHAGSTNQ